MVAIFYLGLLLITSIPAFQDWGAKAASQLLEEKIKSRVDVEKVRLNMLGRIVLDNVKLYDQQDTLMLKASRITAKLDFLPLIERKIRISGAQLIGAKTKLYKDGDAPCNFQFLVDAFSRKDSTPSRLNLKIEALLVRRGEIHFDLLDKPITKGKFNPNHLHLTDLSLTSRVHFIKSDSLAVDLRDFSFAEESGLQVERLALKAYVGKDNATIQDFQLDLPNSSIQSTSLAYLLKKGENLWQGFSAFKGNLEGSLSADICPRDFSCFVPKLTKFEDNIKLTSNVRLSNGTLQLPNASLSDKHNNLSLLLSTTIRNLEGSPSLSAEIKELRTGANIQQFLTKNLQGEPREVSAILTRLGSTKTSGTLTLQNKLLHTKLQTESGLGVVTIDANLADMQKVDARLTATRIRLGNLLGWQGEEKATTLSFEANASALLPSKDTPAKIQSTGTIKSLIFRGYEHRNTTFAATLDDNLISAELTKDEPNGMVHIALQTSTGGDTRPLFCQAELQDFSPHAMRLTEKYEGERFSGILDADFDDLNLNRPQGEIKLADLEVESEQKGTLNIGDIAIESEVAEGKQQIVLQSDFLNLKANGFFNWKKIPASFNRVLQKNLPSLSTNRKEMLQPKGNNFYFHLQAQDTAIVHRLLGLNLRIPQESTIEGSISDAIGQIALQVHIPQIAISGQKFENIDWRAEAGNASLQTSLQATRQMKKNLIELNLDAYAVTDKVTSRLRWEGKTAQTNRGDISITGLISHDPIVGAIVDAKVNKSSIVINDSAWQVKPATIKYRDKTIDVENIAASHDKKHIKVGGRISAHASDTLTADLAGIDVSNIMDLVNFHKVEFDGKATGTIYATSLMEKPFADAYLQVEDFRFNEGKLGHMDLYANWGKQPRAISLNAEMKGPEPLHHTQLHGTIIPSKGMNDGLDLNIRTSNIDLSFLTKYTKNIFKNLEGRASGWTRVFGPFKFINLEGDLYVEHLKAHILALGTEYHLMGDSVTLRPDSIWAKGARAYDYLGTPGMDEHSALVDAHFYHDSFRNLRFDIDVDAKNMLGYNFPSQGDMSFYGTAYGDAKVKLKGKPGSVDIDVDAVPMPGTVINYNTMATSSTDEANFIDYTPLNNFEPSKSTELDKQTASLAQASQNEGGTDLRISFDIDANPNAEIRILMDTRTGDNISLFGDGHLRADYYNKGRFQLYGAYRVEEGTYRLSIRDLIRKNFSFQRGGTIVFGGYPMQAALNLKAIHTVPNVSLDDLSTTGLGFSNTRVDCIMNIGGIAGEPSITFDFDLPNANEDEKQMVRSVMSSEEDRDMQAIYLLGIGRFYSYGLQNMVDSKQGQGTMAMNSMLSNVLSSRFDQIMTQALGTTGWSLGTNLRTGQDGWQELDAEAIISGKMLSGRLLFNGNFGYRENRYKMGNNNFIGDFDIQYRLSPRSPFSLKAYNQTNDRYFTQSSLTTQGIGIMFQRDFNRWLDLFRSTKKKEKK